LLILGINSAIARRTGQRTAADSGEG